MINFIKRLLFNGISEKQYDIYVYLKYKYVYKYKKLVHFYKPYTLNYEKDFILTIYCGIGDFLYGIPAFMDIKKQLKLKNKKFIVYIGSANNNYNNANLVYIAKQLNIFDEIHTFHSPRPVYWKCLDLGDIDYDKNKADIYHFVYCVNGYNKLSRIQAVCKQFGLKNNNGLEKSLEIINLKDSNLQNVIDSQKDKKCVFLHLDTRSGEYVYPYILQLVDYLLVDGFSVVLFTKMKDIINQQNKLRYDTKRIINKTIENNRQIKELENNQILLEKITQHKLFSNVIPNNINDTLKLLKEINPYVIAVNSIFWPLTNITETKILALHYINSNDGHQFFHKNMLFVTTNKCSYKRVKKININKYVFSKIDYDIDKKYGYINYHPEYIMFLLNGLITNETK
ncbi:hypothetical protein [Sulfurimonas sp.]|uniref:hypothetical protein n=1 Tax=Sulfurimonas sp. TaxID=2022749 RepID=UPI002AB2F4C5|nr:hypothetical protein [Sulfurimonas sp.]